MGSKLNIKLHVLVYLHTMQKEIILIILLHFVTIS